MMGAPKLSHPRVVDLGTVEVVVSKTTRQTRHDGKAYIEYTFDISIDPELALGPVWRFTARYSSALETHRKLERVAGGRKGGGDGFALPGFPPKYRGTDMVNKQENVDKRGQELRDYYGELFNVPEVMNHPMLSTNMGGLCASALLREKQAPESIAPSLMLTEENNRDRGAAHRATDRHRAVSRNHSTGCPTWCRRSPTAAWMAPRTAIRSDQGRDAEDERGATTFRARHADVALLRRPATSIVGPDREPHTLARRPERYLSGSTREMPTKTERCSSAAVIRVDDETTAGRHCFDIETQETAGRGKLKVRLDAAVRTADRQYMAVLEQQMLLATGAGAGSCARGNDATWGRQCRWSQHQ